MPFLIDTLPLASLTSTPGFLPLPPVALSPVTVYCAVTVLVAGFDNVAVNVIFRVPLSPSSIDASPTDTVDGTPGTSFEIVPSSAATYSSPYGSWPKVVGPLTDASNMRRLVPSYAAM